MSQAREFDLNDPATWPDEDPSKVPSLVAQRDEFKRRSQSSRKALEEIRKTYEAGDLEKLEDLLFMYTACTHSKVQRPKRFIGS